jgi:hypothetical protein
MVSQAKSWRKVSQASVKTTTCYGGCGAQVEYRTNPRVYCQPCKRAKVLGTARAIAEKKRRERGIPAIKGTKIACARCGQEVVLNRATTAKYCRSCYIETTRERSRRISRAKAGVPGSRAAEIKAQKRRRHESARHAINFRFRAAIRRALNGGKRGRKWESLVGYTLADLMAHLERQFLKGMTWNNRGEWEIDHVVPLALFHFDSAEHPDFRAAWALSNLRPIWADDNRKKNRTRTHLI